MFAVNMRAFLISADKRMANVNRHVFRVATYDPVSSYGN